MNKLFAILLLCVACLASYATAQTFTRQIQCTDYNSCLCQSLPKMIAAARGRAATATITNPTTGQREVYDLSKPMSGALRSFCARTQARLAGDGRNVAQRCSRVQPAGYIWIPGAFVQAGSVPVRLRLGRDCVGFQGTTVGRRWPLRTYTWGAHEKICLHQMASKDGCKEEVFIVT
uniref:Uncharacterized protein n=1 Tax=Anopheles culicifacies TaxID=139723 RepID=A0A182MVQ7_9DIPT